MLARSPGAVSAWHKNLQFCHFAWEFLDCRRETIEPGTANAEDADL